MLDELLRIKINIPPLNPNVIYRPHIRELLDTDLTTAEGFARRLTLVSAPAGFGKTTQVREWISHYKNRTAWYSLDENDNEPERFWIYLISALQTISNDVGNGPLSVLCSKGIFSESSPGAASLLTPLLNELFELEQQLILVLDDYHLIDNPQIHEDMVFFIENLPPTLHLAVTTRSDPPWPLARWRVRGMMAEVRMEQLKFSREEARKLFAKLQGLTLSESQLNTLHHKTEGWVTGLHLASFSLSASQSADDFINSFAGSSRHVLHFLSEEVFNSQPEPVREFLLQTSILNRFSAPLCTAVTGIGDCSEILTLLEHNNLFVLPLDDQGTWYRYHHQFADILLYHLKKEYPDKITRLHENAGNWFLESREPAVAVHHFLAANSPEKAAHILHEYYEEILQSEGPELLNRTLKSYPLELIKEYPRLVVHKVLNSLIYKGKDEAEDLINLAENLHYDDNQDRKEFAGMLSAIKSYYYIFSNDISPALENAETALKLLPSDNNYWRMNTAIYSGDARLFSGSPRDAYPFYQQAHRHSQAFDNQFISMTTGFKVATSLYYLGKLMEAEELTRSLLQTARNQGFSRVPRAGLLWTLLGELLREKGNLEEAERCVERGLFLSSPEKPSLGWNCLFKVSLSFSKQEYHNALLNIRQIDSLHLETVLPHFITFPAAVWEARILLEMGKAAGARDVLSKTGILECNEVQGGKETGFLVLSRLLLAEEDKDKSDRVHHLLNRIEKTAVPGQNQRILLETLLVKSLFEERYGSLDTAEKFLTEAMQKGMESGYFQLFFDEKKGLAPVYSRILGKLQSSNQSSEVKMLNYFSDIYRDLTPEIHSALEVPRSEGKDKISEESRVQGLVEELSSRELEILELISQGLSNLDISKKLFLSPGTVKWHNNNIFGKLGVKSRTQAAATARKLNLIP